ncbi:MAG: hypothetical protein RO009_08125 [Pseudorhodoplanes sp.]|nr:hypothetical protein [Pseudorhodoplanes sp.]
MLGDIDDNKIIEILALKPSLVDLEAAAMWLAGDSDILAKDGYQLSEAAAQIVDILAMDEDEAEYTR